MTGRRALLPALLALAGCTATPPPPPALPPAPPKKPAAARFTGVAARQVKQCYRSPRVPHAGKQIVTKIRVRYAPDGAIRELPTVVAQFNVTPDNARYADDMAEAAVEAALRCQPLSLPPDLYQNGWDDFELTFAPIARA